MSAQPVVWMSLAAAGVVLLTGCTGQTRDRSPAPVPGVALPFPEGGVNQTVWLADGWIYFIRMTPEFGSEFEIWRTRAEAKAEQVRMPPVPGCRLTRWNNLHRLPDGRLGVIRECKKEDARDDWYDVMAFTPETGNLENLLYLGRTVVSNITWAPDLKSGYISYTNAICASIAPLTFKGATRFTEPVVIDGKTWWLDQAVFKSGVEGCVDDGRADQPVLLPDGKTLIFAASPASQGKSGDSRMRMAWHYYRWVPGEGNPHRLAQWFGDPLGLEITPDGKWAILASSNGGHPGIWAVDVHSGQSLKLAGGNPKAVSVSPDGKQAVVSFERDTGDPRYDMTHPELRVIDLSMLDSGPR